MLSFKTLSLLSLSACLTLAVDREIIYDKNAKAIFEFDFFDAAQSVRFWGENFTSTYTLDESFKNEVIRAGKFWANILGDNATNLEAIKFSVATMDEENANASSYGALFSGDALLARMLYGALSKEELDRALIQAGYTQEDTMYTGHINMGKLPWYVASNPSTLPMNANYIDIFSTYTHEMMHALGVISVTNNSSFLNNNIFNINLYDYMGTRGGSGVNIVNSNTANPSDFVVNKNTNIQSQSSPIKSLSNATGHVYFRGANVLEVIGSATLGFDSVNGLPINGWEGDYLEMSHIELDNSLMSHQNWRNYTFYMEAELALMQDLGYDFDRKLYYGDSIYESNLVSWQSTEGFNDRDWAGWIEDTYNNSDYGVGLHIYGRNNTATQNHNILSNGTASSGIRVDGSNNTLNIGSNTKIHTLGAYSNALLIAYGKEHNINNGGELVATGKDGIAIHINFGDNALGNNTEYRGSYMLSGESIDFNQYPLSKNDLLQTLNLDSALVSNLTLESNSITKGEKASIYIAENAFVENINIENGSIIKGDMLSLWNPNNDKLDSIHKNIHYTTLNFGTSHTDNIDFSDSILGLDSIKLNVNSQLNAKNISVYDLNINSNAILKLNNTDSTITVKNSFTQNSNSTLQAGLNAGAKLNLYVGNQANIASGANLNFYIAKDFYNFSSMELKKDAASLFQYDTGANISGSFDKIVLIDESNSHILSFSYDELNSKLLVNRNYSKFANNEADESLAKALDFFASTSNANDDNIATFFREIDFLQDTNDITRALNDINLNSYLDTAKILLDFHGNLNKELIFDLDNTSFKDEWISTVSTFGAFGTSKEDGDFVSYKGYGGGVNARVSKKLNENFDLALSLILNANNYELDRGLSSNFKSRGAYLSAYANFDLNSLFFFTALRLGAQRDSIQRNITIASFNENLKAKYNAFSTSELVGVGYDFKLNDSLSLAPLAYIEHNSLSTPSIKENAGAISLNIDKNTYHSLNSFLGLRLGYDKNFTKDKGLKLSFLGGHNHHFIDKLRNEAYLQNDSSNTKFYAQNYLKDKDSLRMQTALDFAAKAFYSRLLLQSDVKRNTDFSGRIEAGVRW